jgi:hypothetical protein
MWLSGLQLLKDIFAAKYGGLGSGWEAVLDCFVMSKSGVDIDTRFNWNKIKLGVL